MILGGESKRIETAVHIIEKRLYERIGVGVLARLGISGNGSCYGERWY